MNKVILQLAVSLDMYLARKDGTVDFLDEIGEDFTEDFVSFQNSIDHIIMGRGTYEKMLEFGDVPFDDKNIIVCTSKELTSKFSHVSFRNESIASILNELSGNIWLFGGSKLIHSFLAENLIDEMEIFVVPTLIGEGIPLFIERDTTLHYNLISTKEYGNNVLLKYKKKEE